MSPYLPVVLGSALLWVLLALSEYSPVVAALLCRISLHRWRMAAKGARHRACTQCHRQETASTPRPRPWEWR